MTTTRPTADELNAKLVGNGFVQVTTYTRSTLYKARHNGWFFEKAGSLYVKSGSKTNRLSHGDALLVGIRTGTLS